MLRTFNLPVIATRPWRLRPGAFIRRLLAPALLVISVWPGVGGSEAFAQGPPPPPTRPAVQYQNRVTLQGVSAVQLAWWFNHIADEDGMYWKALAPATNQSIRWAVNPTDDAHQLIGSLFHSEQRVPNAGFPNDRFEMQAQFQDYITQPRGFVPDLPLPVNVTQGYPDEYTAVFPWPLPQSPFGGQWEDTHEGLIHRSSFISKLPLQVPITQQDFYIEHQANEGLFHSAGAVVRAYKLWLKTHPGYQSGHN